MYLLFITLYIVSATILFDSANQMDAEAQGSASDTSGNPDVAWWCKILTRLVASIAGVGELAHSRLFSVDV